MRSRSAASTDIACSHAAMARANPLPPTRRLQGARRTGASSSSSRGRNMRITILLLVLVAAPITASAQVFPTDATYVPFRCGAAPMTDGFADEAGSLEERDIVGDVDHAAGLGASD